MFLLFQVIAATNRVDILDPALLRSGRLDRKIEFPTPNEEARARIMQIHSRKMNVRLEIFKFTIILISKVYNYNVGFFNQISMIEIVPEIWP